jgi:two-component system response regulator DevR
MTQPSVSTPTRVFLVDDHEVVRRGLVGLVNAERDIEVVGEAGSSASARARIAATRPDVVVLDVHLPDGSGIDLCREILSDNPGLRCLILTGFDDDEAVSAAVAAGAAGYVLKGVSGAEFLEALRRVAAGRTLLNPNLAKRVAQRMREDAARDPRLGSLSPREQRVLTLITEGLTNRQIGSELSLTEKTVKNYVSGVLTKLGLPTRTQAAILSLKAQDTDQK